MTQFIISKETFQQFKSFYLDQAHRKALRPEAILLYNILRGKEHKQGFTPITNPRKITSNGNNPWFAYEKAKQSVFGSIRRLSLPEYGTKTTPNVGFCGMTLPFELAQEIAKALKEGGIHA